MTSLKQLLCTLAFALGVTCTMARVNAQPRYPLTDGDPYFPAQPQQGGGSRPPFLGGSPATDPQQAPVQQPNVPPQPTGALLESAKIVATVADQEVLAGDFNFQINLMLEAYQDKLPAEQLEQQREILIQRLLAPAIESKLLYADFLRTIPLDKWEESMGQIKPKIRNVFRNQLEKMQTDLAAAKKEDLPKLQRRDAQLYNLASLVKKRKLLTLGELDGALREYGSSLEKERRLWGERAMGQNALQSNVNFEPEVTYDELRARYQENIESYKMLPQARWEQLTVKFANHPTEEAALRKLFGMGNSVLRGAPFAAVAKRESEGLKAKEGGLHDWTDQGALASDILDRAIFSLDLDKLSQVIKDDRGLHIIRVKERNPGGYVSFVKAQKDIKEELRREKVRDQMTARLEKLKKEIPVWTVFDEDATETAAMPR